MDERTILVIDDEELIIKSLIRLLEQQNYDVVVAKTGEDALEVVEEVDCSLILVDIRMPGINGVETVKKINNKLSQKDHNTPPIIFITGYADVDVEKEAKALNPVAYIYKPFDIRALLETIKEVLQ